MGPAIGAVTYVLALLLVARSHFAMVFEQVRLLLQQRRSGKGETAADPEA